MTARAQLLTTLTYWLLPLMAVAAGLLFSVWLYRQHKRAYPPVLVPTQVRPLLVPLSSASEVGKVKVHEQVT